MYRSSDAKVILFLLVFISLLISLAEYGHAAPPATADAAWPEFQVNDNTSNAQANADIAQDADGNFVAVWDSEDQDGDGAGVYARLYDRDGSPRTGEILVNNRTALNQDTPSVAMRADGGFVVVWESVNSGAAQNDIYGRRFDADGEALGDEFRINSYSTGEQKAPAVAMNASGAFVAVWTSAQQDGSGNSVYGQRYNADGLWQGPEFRVSNTTNNDQEAPEIAMNEAGKFVVAWQSYQQDYEGWGIYGRSFQSNGNPDGNEFLVNQTVADNQELPKVAMSDIGYVVVWQCDAITGRSVYARVYPMNGQPGGEILVNYIWLGFQDAPGLSIAPNGNFIVTWRSYSLLYGDDEISAHLFDPSGNSIGIDFRVNVNMTGNQNAPEVVIRPDISFVVVWQSEDQDGSDYGVFGRVFNCLTDADCDDGSVCNGVETCENLLCADGAPIDCPVDNLFCNGDEYCSDQLGECISDGNPCDPDEVCNEASDRCDPMADDDVDDDVVDDDIVDDDIDDDIIDDDDVDDDDTADDDTMSDDDTGADDDTSADDDTELSIDDDGFNPDDDADDDDSGDDEGLDVGEDDGDSSDSSGCGC